MAVYPSAKWRPLAANVKQPRMTPRVAILHTAVDAPGNSDLWGWFTQSGLESHFFVHNDGSVSQYMDTGVVAEANYKANGFAVSIETEDDGNPRATPWNPAQVEAIVALLDWLCTTHKIPRRECDRWDGSGIGWHSMWGLNTKANPGVNPWTSALGKDCPGAPRIAQMRATVIPRVVGGQIIEEDDVSAEDVKAALTDSSFRFDGRNPIDMWRQTVATGFANQAATAQILTELRAMRGELDDGEVKILSQIKALGGGITPAQHAQILRETLPGAVLEALVSLAQKPA